MFTQYQHILWDWNGTLLDDAGLCVEAMNIVLARRNLPTITVAQYQELFTFPVRDYYQRLGFDFSNDSFEDLSVEFMAIYEARRYDFPLRQHARVCLEYIKDLGVPQSILSAYPHARLVEFVRHFGLEPFFTQLVGLGDIYASSKLELGRGWMQREGYQPGEVLLIGDTSHDFEVASAIGAECVLVANGHYALPRLQTCGVPIVASLADLLAA